MQAKTIPNLITGLRLALTPVLAALLLNGHFRPAFALLLLMAFSDALDGFLAKRLGWQSRVGEFIDPLADKLMLVSAFVSLWWVGLLPAWLTALVLGRDAVIVAGGAAYHFFIGRFNARPSYISKINTFLQLVLVGAVVFGQFGALPAFVAPGLISLVAVTTLWSGIAYIVVWGVSARDARRAAAGR